MKSLLVVAIAIISSQSANAGWGREVNVRGYYRDNGTYVQPHVRTAPDGNVYNNYSFPANQNARIGNTNMGGYAPSYSTRRYR
jgi:hypothetical protein